MREKLIWAVVVIYAVVAGIKPLIHGTAFFELMPAIIILVPVFFVLLHAPREIGWKLLAVFILLAFVISWSYESLSIATGYPFGNYYYTENLGFKLGTVPFLIMPAYFGVCYISWLIAQLILGAGVSEKREIGLLTRVVTASFIMVMWDLAMDPARANIAQGWTWEEGGGYFGVPLQNFAGWFLCVATIFLAYGLIERKSTLQRRTPDVSAYAQALGLYAAIAVEFVAYAIFASNGSFTDASGQIWNRRDLYQSTGLVAIFTMGFVVLIGVLTLRGRER